ncbi:hypothetical protein Bbelb_106070, partial [Branchiostoma belcheri]
MKRNPQCELKDSINIQTRRTRGPPARKIHPTYYSFTKRLFAISVKFRFFVSEDRTRLRLPHSPATNSRRPRPERVRSEKPPVGLRALAGPSPDAAVSSRPDLSPRRRKGYLPVQVCRHLILLRTAGERAPRYHEGRCHVLGTDHVSGRPVCGQLCGRGHT